MRQQSQQKGAIRQDEPPWAVPFKAADKQVGTQNFKYEDEHVITDRLGPKEVSERKRQKEACQHGDLMVNHLANAGVGQTDAKDSKGRREQPAGCYGNAGKLVQASESVVEKGERTRKRPSGVL